MSSKDMTKNNKTAIILGASGLVGSSLLNLLLENDIYKEVIAFVRKDLSITHPKLTVHIIDFNKPDTFLHLVKCDDLFCCLGTTIKQAGSQEAFRRVDYYYPAMFAEIAEKNGAMQYLLVSSIGANAASSTFYLRTKGECENAVRDSGISFVSVFRPSFLMGDRKEFRLGEKLSLPFLKLFSFLLVGKLRKYRAIKASQVAKAMMLVAQDPQPGFTVYESDKIQEF